PGSGSSVGHWTNNNGGTAHPTTLPPINYRSDREGCAPINSPGGADVVAPTDPDQDKVQHSRANWAVSLGFKSNHPGGANFLFGDGSIHFLPEDINHDIYQLLGCRNDGRHIEDIP